MHERNDDTARLAELIEGIETAMLTTADASGELHSRPMATQAISDQGEILFYTRRESAKVDEAEHQAVNVAYADPRGNRYVSVCGRAMLDTNPETIRAHWSPELKAWFPGGVDDPQLALLRITIDHAEYWTAPGGPLATLAQFAKAAVGKPDRIGDHGTIGTGR